VKAQDRRGGHSQAKVTEEMEDGKVKMENGERKTQVSNSETWGTRLAT